MLASQAVAEQRPFNLGQIATAKQVAGWDIDVRPDGLGAPVGAAMLLMEKKFMQNYVRPAMAILVKLLTTGRLWSAVKAH